MNKILLNTIIKNFVIFKLKRELIYRSKINAQVIDPSGLPVTIIEFKQKSDVYAKFVMDLALT